MNLGITLWDPSEQKRTTCYFLPEGLEGPREPLFVWWIRLHGWDFECAGLRGVLQPAVHGVTIWFDARNGERCTWSVERGKEGHYDLLDEQRNALCEMDLGSPDHSSLEPAVSAKLRQREGGSIEFHFPGAKEVFRALGREGGLIRCGSFSPVAGADHFSLFLLALACFRICDPLGD